MIDMCVSMLEDYFESTDTKKISQFLYILLGNVDDNNASFLVIISERGIPNLTAI